IIVESEDLRKMARNQIARPGELPGIGFELSRGDAQKGGLARAIAPHEAHALAFADGDGGAVEDEIWAVANGEFAGAGNGIGHEWKGRTFNIQRPTSNLQCRGRADDGGFPNWVLDVGCWMLDVFSVMPAPSRICAGLFAIALPLLARSEE